MWNLLSWLGFVSANRVDEDDGWKVGIRKFGADGGIIISSVYYQSCKVVEDTDIMITDTIIQDQHQEFDEIHDDFNYLIVIGLAVDCQEFFT